MLYDVRSTYAMIHFEYLCCVAFGVLILYDKSTCAL